MDAHSLESFRECKLNLLEILEVETEDWVNDHYKQLIKKAGNEAKLIITTASHYLLQLRDELRDFKEILRKLNIKMAEQVIEITSRGLFIDGETLSLNGKEDLSSLNSDEFRFEFGEAKCLLDRQVQIKLNLDIKKSIKQTRQILDKVDDDIMVNTVAVEKLEDFIQKWAEKVIEEETTDQDVEGKQDGMEHGDTKEEDGKENAGEEDENGVEKQDDNNGTGKKPNEPNDRERTETADEEDKKSEDDANDGDIEGPLTKVIDDNSNDSSKTLIPTETERLDGKPENDVDENDEVTGNESKVENTPENGSGSDDKNALENTENDKSEDDMIEDDQGGTVNDDDGEEDNQFANMNDDDDGEDKSDCHNDEDIEMLMLNELQEQSDQGPDNPFPAEDWDTFVYYRPIKHSENEDAEEVMCAVIVKRETLRQNDITCSVSKNPNDLRACLKNKNEKLLSYFVTVKFLGEPVDVGECFVFVPYQQPSQTLEHVIRTRSQQGQWTDLPPKNITNLASLPGVKLSGLEVHEKDSFGLIVVAKEKQIRCHVPEEGIAIEPENDRNMTILVSPVTFSGETCISFSTHEVSTERLGAYKKDNSEFKNVCSLDARLHIVCDEATEDDLSIVFYDLLRTEKTDSDGFRMPQKEALRRCWRRMVNGLNIEKLLARLEERGIPTKSRHKKDSVNFHQKIENEESMGDKARLLLREIEQWTKEDINGFVVCLRESNQSHLAKLFTEAVDRIAKELKSSTENTQSAGNSEIKILVRRDDGPWLPSDPVTITERPEDFVLVLPPGGREYQVIVLHLSGQMTKRDLCAFGDVISNDVCGTQTSLICRQHSTQPEKITIQCVRSEIAASRIEQLADNGYTYGWEEETQFGMCDGEALEITFDLNLGLVDIGEDGVLRMYYFSYLDTAQFVGDLFLVDERAQSQEPMFSGDLYYNVGAVKQRPPRSGCLKVTLPKSAAPYIDRTPFRMLNIQVIALAKYIGYRLSALGRESVLHFASTLVEDEALRRRLYVKVRRVCRGKDDAARCEMFIINWARQRLKFENKALLLIDALGFEPEIQADVKDFSLIFSDSGILCDHYLQRMSEFIGEEWIALGRNLGITDRDLRLLQIDYKDKAERNFQLLDTFRLSRTAIEQGTGVIRFLLRACKSAGCISGLITFIRYIAGIFKEQTFMRSQSWMSLGSAMPSVEIT